MELPTTVVYAGFQEIREHTVAVEAQISLADRHAHLLGVIRRQDIAEITGGHDDMEALPLPQLNRRTADRSKRKYNTLPAEPDGPS